MPVVTLAQLRAQVRQASDLEGAGATGFVKDAELNSLINRACWALDGKLHASWEDYYATVVDITLTGSSHPLPADFLKLLYLDVKNTYGQWQPLQEYTLRERNDARNSKNTSAVAQRYRVMGQKIILYPGLAASASATLAYYPQQPALVLDTDTRNYPNGWEHWAVLYCAIIVVNKEERDTSALERMLALEERRMEAEVPDRSGNTTRYTNSEDSYLEDGISPLRRL